MQPMWTALGPTLEKISIGCVVSTSEWSRIAPEYDEYGMFPAVSANEADCSAVLCIDDITKHCKKLTNLALEHFDWVCGERLPLALVLKLGPQLRVVRIMGRSCPLRPAHFEKIISNCSLAVFDIEIGSCFENLNVLGDRLRMLKLHWDDFGWSSYDTDNDRLFDRIVEESRIRTAARHCTALEEIVYSGDDSLSVKVLSLFLSHPLPKLRCFTALHFRGGCGLSGSLTVPGILADIASNVESVSISCQHMDQGAFHKFAMVNKNLKRIRLELKRHWAEDDTESARKAANAAVRLIQDVAVCEMLEEVCIRGDWLCSRSSQISGACSVLHGRNVDVFLGGIQYSPQ